MSRILLIVNPRAGRERGLEVAQAIERDRSAAGDSVRIAATEKRNHAVELARTAHDCDRIGVIGGDGTLREVVSGLGMRCAEIPLAFIPLGNANVIARELGIALDDPRRAASALGANAEAHLDIGFANDHEFLAMIGCGFDAFPTRFVAWSRSTSFGRAIYAMTGGGDFLHVIGGIASLLRFFPTRFSIDCDGVAIPGRFGSVIVANVKTYAKGWSFTPEASFDDARLDVCATRPAAIPFVLPALLLARLRKRMPRWLASYGRGSSITITSASEFHWQLDGEAMGRTGSIRIATRGWQARILRAE